MLSNSWRIPVASMPMGTSRNLGGVAWIDMAGFLLFLWVLGPNPIRWRTVPTARVPARPLRSREWLQLSGFYRPGFSRVRAIEVVIPSQEACARWAAIGERHTAPPLPEFLATVVRVDGDLDQARPVVCEGLFHRPVQIADGRGTQPETVAFVGVEDLHEPRIIPVLDPVIRAVVDLRLDRVAAVVDQHDDRLHPVPDHRRDLLRGELE